MPDSVLLERLLSRGREDDNEAIISNRLQVYRQQTAPLIDYYQQHELLINVNGDRELSQISEELETIVKS